MKLIGNVPHAEIGVPTLEDGTGNYYKPAILLNGISVVTKDDFDYVNKGRKSRKITEGRT